MCIRDSTYICYEIFLFRSIQMVWRQGWIKTLGAPCQRVMGALPFPPLPFPLRPFLPPSPLSASPPSRPLFCHISPFLLPFLLQKWQPKYSYGAWERCKLPQWGLGRSPSRQTIWCIFESKRAAQVAAIFYEVLRKNICNFHYFLHKNN